MGGVGDPQRVIREPFSGVIQGRIPEGCGLRAELARTLAKFSRLLFGFSIMGSFQVARIEEEKAPKLSWLIGSVPRNTLIPS